VAQDTDHWPSLALGQFDVPGHFAVLGHFDDLVDQLWQPSLNSPNNQAFSLFYDHDPVGFLIFSVVL